MQITNLEIQKIVYSSLKFLEYNFYATFILYHNSYFLCFCFIRSKSFELYVYIGYNKMQIQSEKIDYLTLSLP